MMMGAAANPAEMKSQIPNCHTAEKGIPYGQGAKHTEVCFL